MLYYQNNKWMDFLTYLIKFLPQLDEDHYTRKLRYSTFRDLHKKLSVKVHYLVNFVLMIPTLLIHKNGRSLLDFVMYFKS